MDPSVIELIRQSMFLVLMLSLPPIFVASIVGLLFSLFQAITQLQEQTLSFGIKLIAVSITLFLSAGWMTGQLIQLSQTIFEKFYLLQ
ncbi:MAG: type III secretion system export apparatus subunit SctS [Succinivibrio dextrinosolvens]|uniref:type III secretion system export apparatus subunit SctS n=1 Tax=Succinivibrio sp. TaxID=2053619 RepID=UPI0025D6D3A4|nr:type III secretion system export apparatus subunit SctS [Succinivibrio sp.]MBQ9221019.1 type III secretion system export apparatus subunit SctS [Succinivibrio sp.]MDY6420746.1 type III secretion system export apparatus subunit SctS [Succinivibrio dextrinosolvens]